MVLHGSFGVTQATGLTVRSNPRAARRSGRASFRCHRPARPDDPVFQRRECL